MYEADRRVILAHQRLVAQVRARVVRWADARWMGLGSWQPADIDEFILQVVPAVASGERQVAQLTVAYLDSLARIVGAPPPKGVALVSSEQARGQPQVETYRRPAVTVYTALKEGKPLPEAVVLGGKRLHSLITTDLQLAATHTERNHISAGTAVGFRRMLTGAENCVLCTIAASQRYHRGNLRPIHPGCDCTVVPIYGDHDPGQVINDELYAKAMEAFDKSGIESHRGTDGRYRDASSLMIRDHGEYGPTLTWRDQSFTGPRDI